MRQISVDMYHRYWLLRLPRVHVNLSPLQDAGSAQLAPPSRPNGYASYHVAIFLLWLTGLAVGFFGLYTYEFSGTTDTNSPAYWPDDIPLLSSKQGPTLLFFVHPRCPCTAASISELDRVLSRNPSSYQTYVVFPVPSRAPTGWLFGSNHSAAQRLPHAEIIEDDSASITNTFGVVLSGTTLVYGPDGRLIYEGGITASRGHAGTSYGSLALEAIAQGDTSPRTGIPVFGCPVAAPQKETPS